MNHHNQFMDKAFSAALSRTGISSPNPPVGAVVVKNGIEVSSGGTQVCGGDHAEVCALNAAGENARGADLYVSLEPCAHHGKTPPCTEAIIKAGISRVILPVLDPNPDVNGKGAEALRAAGIELIILEERAAHAEQILLPFFTRIEKRRPHIIYKMAHTADGFTASSSGDSKWISSELSRFVVHRLRSMCDAVMVGKKTCEADNPSLTCRMNLFPDAARTYFSQAEVLVSGTDNIVLKYLLSGAFDHETVNPLRVIAGIPDMPLDDEVLFLSGGNTIVFEREENIPAIEDNPLYQILGQKNILKIVPAGADFHEAVLSTLYDDGVLLLMLEGGSTLAGSFLRKKLIDQFLSFTGPRLIGGGRGIFTGIESGSMEDADELYGISTAMLGDDLLYHGYL